MAVAGQQGLGFQGSGRSLGLSKMTELGGVACVSAETVVARALPEVPTLGLVYEDVVPVAEAEPKERKLAII